MRNCSWGGIKLQSSHLTTVACFILSAGVGILIPKIGISGSGLKKMESGRDGMGFSIPIFSGRDGIEKKLNRDPDLMIFSSFFSARSSCGHFLNILLIKILLAKSFSTF